jgi:hypothetical protein
MAPTHLLLKISLANYPEFLNINIFAYNLYPIKVIGDFVLFLVGQE